MEDINTDEKNFWMIRVRLFFEFNSSLLLEYGRKVFLPAIVTQQ